MKTPKKKAKRSGQNCAINSGIFRMYVFTKIMKLSSFSFFFILKYIIYLENVGNSELKRDTAYNITYKW